MKKRLSELVIKKWDLPSVDDFWAMYKAYRSKRATTAATLVGEFSIEAELGRYRLALSDNTASNFDKSRLFALDIVQADTGFAASNVYVDKVVSLRSLTESDDEEVIKHIYTELLDKLDAEWSHYILDNYLEITE